MHMHHSILQSSPASGPVMPEAMAAWEKKRGEYQKQLGPLVTAMKGSSIDPISLDCTQNTAKLTGIAIERMESEGVCMQMCTSHEFHMHNYCDYEASCDSTCIWRVELCCFALSLKGLCGLNISCGQLI